MPTLISRRLLQAVVMLFGLSIFFFVLLRQVPGGPCAAFEGGGVTPAQRSHDIGCRTQFHLNDSYQSQYLAWIGAVAHGDLGESQLGGSVSSEILSRAPATLLLAGIAYFFQELIALPLGIFAALRRYSFFDSVFTLFSYIGLSMPAFWLCAVFITFLAVDTGTFPAGGIVGDLSHIPTFNGPGYWAYVAHHPWHAFTDFLAHLAMPAAVLAVGGIAVDSRFMRASMLEVINQDYVRTARAKGLSRPVVVFKHALRNALLPIITNVSLAVPQLIGGAIVVETIFGWPGMGQLFSHAIGGNDYATLQALLLISALGVLVGNMAADVTYAWIDPRIRYD